MTYQVSIPGSSCFTRRHLGPLQVFFPELPSSKLGLRTWGTEMGSQTFFQVFILVLPPNSKFEVGTRPSENPNQSVVGKRVRHKIDFC